MDKILIVLKSEFLRRVKSKWFVITTLLGPILLIGIAVVPALIGILASENDDRRIAVVDETGVLLPALQTAASEMQYEFVAAVGPVDSVRAAVRAGTYDGYLLLPAGLLAGAEEATYYSVEGGGLSLESRLERVLDRSVEQHRLAERNVPPEVLEILETHVAVRMLKLTEEGETADSALAYSAVGYIMGFIIYVAMFVYGAYVMQGVMEEKQSRVVEVMVSSVRPFELLMGKVLGIGAMGLVQLGLWAVLMMLGITFAGSAAALFLDPSDFNLPVDASQDALLQAADVSIPYIPPSIFVWFLLFFLGGYLLYASLFAAIGSSVEQQQDAQGLMFPVTMLIIIPLMFITFLIESPNATVSVVMSMIPFFSPILMVVRVTVTEVPFWQVGGAFVLLVATFVGAVWVSARIYRVGILMYGKKPSLKDLVRWFRYA